MSQDHHNHQEEEPHSRIAFARTEVRDAAQRTVKCCYQYSKAGIWLILTPLLAWWNLPGDRKNVIFTGVIATATVGYFVYAGLQWRTMDSTLTEMKTANTRTDLALRETQRPVITFGGPDGVAVSIEKPKIDGDKSKITLHFYN